METQAVQPKNTGGRPTNYNDDTVKQIAAALQLGLSISTACDLGGISRETYYTWLKEKEGFSDKMTKAQHHSKVLSANIVSDVLQDYLRAAELAKAGKEVKYKYSHELRVNTAKWMLEKQEREKFGSQSMVAAKTETNDQGGTTTTIIYATDNQLEQLLDHISNNSTETIDGQFAESDGYTETDSQASSGTSEDSPGQLPEAPAPSAQEESVAGGSDQGGAPPVRSGELPHEHSENQSLPQP